jgi:hypothetical protein
MTNQPITPLNTINTVSTGFRPFDGEWKTTTAPIKASTALAGNISLRWEIVSNDVTGNLVSGSTNSGVNSTGADFYGILVAPIRSTDTDYATAQKLKEVYIPLSAKSRAYVGIGAGTFTASDVGKTVAIHTDGISIACDTKGLGCRIVGFLNSTTAIVEFSCATTLTA